MEALRLQPNQSISYGHGGAQAPAARSRLLRNRLQFLALCRGSHGAKGTNALHGAGNRFAGRPRLHTPGKQRFNKIRDGEPPCLGRAADFFGNIDGDLHGQLPPCPAYRPWFAVEQGNPNQGQLPKTKPKCGLCRDRTISPLAAGKPGRYAICMYEDFHVADRWTGEDLHCRWKANIVAIATRHADAVDVRFDVNGRPMWIALPCTAWVEQKQRTGKVITDQLAAQIAGRYLKQLVNEGYDSRRELYTMTVAEVLDHLDVVVEEAKELGEMPTLPILSEDRSSFDTVRSDGRSGL